MKVRLAIGDYDLGEADEVEIRVIKPGHEPEDIGAVVENEQIEADLDFNIPGIWQFMALVRKGDEHYIGEVCEYAVHPETCPEYTTYVHTDPWETIGDCRQEIVKRDGKWYLDGYNAKNELVISKEIKGMNELLEGPGTPIKQYTVKPKEYKRIVKRNESC